MDLCDDVNYSVTSDSGCRQKANPMRGGAAIAMLHPRLNIRTSHQGGWLFFAVQLVQVQLVLAPLQVDE
jgi:hypothetical protein